MSEAIDQESRRPSIRGANKLSRTFTFIALFTLGIALLIFTFRNIGNRFFWTDESSTFMTSLGWPGIGDEPGSLSQMWTVTMQAFLDPGLFHLTSRFIGLYVGTSIELLRVVPFVFFLLYLFALLLLNRMVGIPLLLSLGVVAGMLFENITPYYAFEFRPYSAALASSVAMPLLVLWFLKSRTWWRLACVIGVFSFLALQQYTVQSVAIGSSAALIVAAFVNPDSRSKTKIWVLSSYLIAFLPVVYLLTRFDQFSDRNDSIRYTGETVLQNQPLSRVLEIFQTNLLSLTALPRTVFLVLVMILIVFRKRIHYDLLGKAHGNLIVLLWTYVFIGTLASIFASWTGVLPWILGTRWSITEVGFIAVSLTGLVGIFVQSGLGNRAFLAPVVATVCIATCLASSYRLVTYERGNDYDYLRYLAPTMLEGGSGKTLVDYWIYPDVRYWIEYSGQYEELKEYWRRLEPRMTPGYVRADSKTVADFLASDDDRLLLAGSWALEDFGRSLPTSVRIVKVPDEILKDSEIMDAPVLLVKLESEH